MLTDKGLKKKYKKQFSKHPEKSYPVKAIKSLGMKRGKCKKCGKFFWNTDKKRKVCGDAECSGGYTFIGKSRKNKIKYVDFWKQFSKILNKQGYYNIDRYPVVARWRDDISFVEASIDDFIPYVVNGVSPPPQNPLIVPQSCLRFNDLDNVGITGAHYSCFLMVGQHRFENKKDYDFNQYLLDLYQWFDKGLGLKPEELVLHEDVWAGSGNFGPCVEFFSHGLELANQVYMQYKQTAKGKKDLDIKVLDMGLGYERNVWFSQGKSTSYETTFPTVMEKLKKETGIKPNKETIKKFLPYSSYLNIDEVANIEKAWNKVAKKIKISADDLKKTVLPLSALYSIAEHSRALLFAINDGALPSNVGGGYNLRVILRRALSFMQEYEWDLDLADICGWHAKYLKPLFPELSNNLDDIQKILNVEKKKYLKTRKKAKKTVKTLVKSGKEIEKNKLIELYESQGISPEMVKEYARKGNKEINIPENFYALIAEKHKMKRGEEKERLDVSKYPETKKLYYEKENKKEFTANVLAIIGDWVILDETLFYPQGGGQACDKGMLNNKDVIDVQNFGGVIAHKIKGEIRKKKVKGVIDWERRTQLKKHHTAIHLINAAAREILGNHVWQGGSKKTEEKAHLDITHYQSLSEKDMKEIEQLSNKWVKQGININKMVLPRVKAEKKYGMRLYQGGAVPGKNIHIVEIKEVDVEACGGLHLNNTKNVGKIIITSSERIQDGLVRINIVAGNIAKQYEKEIKEIVDQSKEILDTNRKDLIKETKKLFNKWKKAGKKLKRKTKEKARERIEDLKEEMENGVLIKLIDANQKELQEISKKLTKENTLLILLGKEEDKINVLVSSTKKYKANKIAKQICGDLGGGGGGNEKLGQGQGKDINTEQVMEKLRIKYE